MAQAVVRPRTNTLERWEKALQRAIENGIEVFTVNDTGERMVSSASRLDTLYRTDGRSCSCEAALAGDPVCQHRAAVRFCLGWLALPEPAPAMVDCAACCGCGERYFRGGSTARCDTCKGAGRVPAPLPVMPGAAPESAQPVVVLAAGERAAA